jgi:hypothetical protein
MNEVEEYIKQFPDDIQISLNQVRAAIWKVKFRIKENKSRP